MELSARLLACYRDLKQASIAGVQDVVPSYTELAVHFDPLEVDPLTLRARVEDRLNRMSASPERLSEGAVHVLPVRYDGADLQRVADHTGRSIEEVIARHVRPEYTVAMIGFLPHFPYCLGLDPVLEMPRLSSPRTTVPAGSVAIVLSRAFTGEDSKTFRLKKKKSWSLASSYRG